VREPATARRRPVQIDLNDIRGNGRQRLARLGAKVRVLSVAHAPQVAARATTHMRISKDLADKGASAATQVAPLADEHRREEIARTLSGATITE